MAQESVLTPTCLLLDLDGTLVDSAAGITASVAATLTVIGVPVPDSDTLRSFVGPPMRQTFREVVGLPMGVATSKVEDQAERITEHHGLAAHLVTVCGTSDAAGRATKRDVIRECLRRMREQGVDVSRPLMVGDRGYDVLSAERLAGDGDRSLVRGAHVFAGFESPAHVGKSGLTIGGIRVRRLDHDVGRHVADHPLVARIRASARQAREAQLPWFGGQQWLQVDAVGVHQGTGPQIGDRHDAQGKAQVPGKTVPALGHEFGERAVDTAEADEGEIVSAHVKAPSRSIARHCGADAQSLLARPVTCSMPQRSQAMPICAGLMITALTPRNLMIVRLRSPGEAAARHPRDRLCAAPSGRRKGE
jgi:phosphoglycolate phosphatase